MGLGPDRDHMIRKVLNGTEPNPEAESIGLRADHIAAAWPSGSTLPTAAAEKWPGRSFWHTGQRTWYVCDGTTWLAVGGQYAIPLSDFGSPRSGYSFDNEGGASYAFRNGRRIDLRLRLQRNSGVLGHGASNVLFSTVTAYRPAGVGSWPLAANQSGGSASAKVVGAVLNDLGQLYALSPTDGATTLEVTGSYYLP